jgi:hypothetical protein
MATHYSIIRFVPDAVANESINVGVIAIADKTVKTAFINSWSRARALGGKKADYLREIVKDISAGQELLFADGEMWSENAIREYLSKWRHMIECTELRGSVKSIDSLLPELVSLYLKDIQKPRSKITTRKAAAAAAFNAASMAVQAKFGSEGKDLVKRNQIVPGKIEGHECDVALVNGKLYGAALGFSFRVADSAHLKTEVDAIAFAIEDMRAANPKLPIAVSYVPPASSTSSFDRAKKVLTSVGAEFVDYQKVSTWATKAAGKIPKSALAH